MILTLLKAFGGFLLQSPIGRFVLRYAMRFMAIVILGLIAYGGYAYFNRQLAALEQLKHQVHEQQQTLETYKTELEQTRLSHEATLLKVTELQANQNEIRSLAEKKHVIVQTKIKEIVNNPILTPVEKTQQKSQIYIQELHELYQASQGATK